MICQQDNPEFSEAECAQERRSTSTCSSSPPDEQQSPQPLPLSSPLPDTLRLHLFENNREAI